MYRIQRAVLWLGTAAVVGLSSYLLYDLRKNRTFHQTPVEASQNNGPPPRLDASPSALELIRKLKSEQINLPSEVSPQTVPSKPTPLPIKNLADFFKFSKGLKPARTINYSQINSLRVKPLDPCPADDKEHTPRIGLAINGRSDSYGIDLSYDRMWQLGEIMDRQTVYPIIDPENNQIAAFIKSGSYYTTGPGLVYLSGEQSSLTTRDGYIYRPELNPQGPMSEMGFPLGEDREDSFYHNGNRLGVVDKKRFFSEISRYYCDQNGKTQQEPILVEFKSQDELRDFVKTAKQQGAK